jgi:LacI family transcriptional regulator
MRRAARPNIYAVADRAGVSIATVSRVQRDRGVVAPETRDRVLRAIEELGYRPNDAGRALAEQRTDAIGIVFPDLSGPYYSEVIGGCEGRVVAEARSLLILGTHGRERAADLVFDLAGRVDGLILMGRTVPDEVVLDLDRDGVPLVLLARAGLEGVPAVRAENVAAAEALAGHLLRCGHESIAFLGDPASSPDAAERWQGFLAAHERAGRRPPAAPVPTLFDEDHGHSAAMEALGAAVPPTALMCASDEIALGALAAAHERGLHVPGDAAITGWDDIQVARYVSPALTTVRQPLSLIGARAAELLFERIHTGATPAGEVLPTDLVIRASCGCARPSQTSRGGV